MSNSNANASPALRQELRRIGKPEWAVGLETCGKTVRYLYCEQCNHEVDVGYNCKLKACPRCLNRRAYKLQKQYLKAINRFREPRMWTLTLKSTKQLKHGVERLRDAFTKLRRRKVFRKALRGGIYAIEANPHPDGTWNVHLHMVVDASYVPQQYLSEVWKDITKDSFIVYLNRVDSPKRSLKYVLEYLNKGPASKKNPWPAWAVAKFMRVLENYRLVQVFGSLYRGGERPAPFKCPCCGLDMWRIVDALSGETIWSPWAYYRAYSMKTGP